MVEYRMGKENEKEEIVDFLNYVFSQAHRPHDFKTLTPKSYADDALNLGALHYMATDNDKIKACVANRVVPMSVAGHILTFGIIGNVGVHPYDRGKGHMKKLMHMAISDAKNRGMDLLALGGQRQRYGYYGFENAGANLCYTLSKENLRHCFAELDCSAISFRPINDATDIELEKARVLYERSPMHALRSKEEFLNIMHTWDLPCRLIEKDEQMIGYAYGNFHELVLETESDFPLVLKALFAEDKLTEVNLTIAPHQGARADFLQKICESSSIRQMEMILVLNWERVLSAFLSLQASLKPLQDGSCIVRIENETFRLVVTDGNARVTKEDTAITPDLILSNARAQQVFFNLDTLLRPEKALKNWTPLPFTIDSPDGY